MRRRFVRSAQRCAPSIAKRARRLAFSLPSSELPQQVEVADDDAQHVVEVVRDAAGEPADRLELRGVQQALLELLAAR